MDFGSTSFTEEGFFEEFVDAEMSEEEGGKRRIMSVELALQRESACAQKVAKLLPPQHNDNIQSSGPSQASSLTLKPGAERTMSSENLSPSMQLSYTKPFLQIQAAGSSSCLQPPQLQHFHANQNLQTQPSKELSCLPRTQLQQSYSKNSTKLQPSENLSNFEPTQMQQYYPKNTLQKQQSVNLSCLSPKQLQKVSQTLQIQSSQKPSSTLPLLVSNPMQTPQCQAPKGLTNLQLMQLKQSYAKNTFRPQSPENPSSHLPTHLQQPCTKAIQNQSSENLSRKPAPQLQLSCARQTIQTPSSENLSCIVPLQMQQPHHNQTQSSLQAPSSENLSCIVPLQMQQPHHNQTQSSLQAPSSENLSCIVPLQMQQPHLNQTLQAPSSENLSCIVPLQMQQPYHSQIQSSGSLSSRPPTQLQQSRNMPTFRHQPVSLVCKVCQVPCSSACQLRRHQQGKKHRARLSELRLQNSVRLQNNVQAINIIPRIGIEPVWCDICKIRCMNEECYLQHLNGKKHATAIQAIKVAMEAKGEGRLLNLNQN